MRVERSDYKHFSEMFFVMKYCKLHVYLIVLLLTLLLIRLCDLFQFRTASENMTTRRYLSGLFRSGIMRSDLLACG